MKHYQVVSKSAVTDNPVLICITAIKEIADCVCVLLNNGQSETIAEVTEYEPETELEDVQQT